MEWRSIQGFEGYYEVSDEGRVRSVDRDLLCADGVTYHRKGHAMKLSLGASGYLVVNLRKYGQSNVKPVHKLVALAFIPNPNNYPVVNHIDGDKTNNNVSNLEWTTYSGNNTHALRNGLRSPRGNTIAQLRDDGSVVGIYRSTCEAARKTGISIGSISHCLNGRTHHAGGYVWKKVLEDVTTIPTGSTPEDELPVEVQR